ncbi:hypothetical protein Pcinc_037101 [Petrolisthes cinctipes]|uniref:Uncharacterized protein n=1 Tax=Petrolisthes cinctipes TaxID=88211 RepID=A0AAE1ELX3_PETCI|nr:hypothetical protein Pcinc_037101 [Petrolisthes cinctipes]
MYPSVFAAGGDGKAPTHPADCLKWSHSGIFWLVGWFAGCLVVWLAGCLSGLLLVVGLAYVKLTTRLTKNHSSVNISAMYTGL